MNRCKIAGSQGIITLSVPLINGREQKTIVKDIRINPSENWQLAHQKTIKSCYGKSPFFEHYYTNICQIIGHPHRFLLDVNMAILHQLQAWIKWQGLLSLSTQFLPPTQVPLVHHKSGKSSPPIIMQPYQQVFADRNPFAPNLSLLDAIFCVGPSLTSYLEQ